MNHKQPPARSLISRTLDKSAVQDIKPGWVQSGDQSLDLAITDLGSGDRAGSSSRSNVLALEVTEEAGIGRGEGSRAAKSVTLAATANERAADASTARNSEILASSTGLNHGCYVLKFVAKGC